MRVTLNIDDDVLQAAKERARREHSTAGQVLSTLARAALNGTATANRFVDTVRGYGFKAFAPRGPGVTNDTIDRLREDDAY